jgi:hypothetical protein
LGHPKNTTGRPRTAGRTTQGASSWHDNLVFLENIEWFDESGAEMIHRTPETGSGRSNWGAQLTVRESQAAVMFYQGRALDAFPAGRHTLKTANIPLLTKLLSAPWGMSSPLRAEVYFVNLKIFPNLKWGTREPVAFRDSELGLIRLRAFGIFDVQVAQPVLFINSLVGTQGVFSTAGIDEYLSRIIVSRFNDYLGEHIDTVFNLPGRYRRNGRGAQGTAGRRFQPPWPGPGQPVHQFHHPAGRRAAGHRRQVPPGCLRRPQQTAPDESGHGRGKGGRKPE